MEAKTSLVGTDRAVELHAVTVVNLNLTLVIYPRNAEEDGALGSGETLKKSLFPVLVLIGLDHDAKGLENFLNCLVEFGLSGVLSNYSFQDFINI